MLRLLPGLVRSFDAAFLPWDRIPGGRIPEEAIPRLSPSLVAEVLRASNTKAEMERRRRDSFAAGVEVIWLIDPKTRTASVYRRNSDAPQHYVASEAIEETEVLPGFRHLLADLFAELDERDFVKPVVARL